MNTLKKKICIPITDSMTSEEKRVARTINRRLACIEEDKETKLPGDSQEVNEPDQH